MSTHFDSNHRSRPTWVDEEICLQNLLNTYIHKLEKGHRLTLRVNEKTIPELFQFDSDEPQYLWTLITTLDNEYHIFSIRYARNKPYQEKYENAQLTFNPDKEAMVREWLNRPALDPYTLVWHDSVRKAALHFEDHGQALMENTVRHADKGPEQTVRAFSKIRGRLGKPITLRALSAQCFWGDSKFLDSREELIKSLFPLASTSIKPRPILINVYLAAEFNSVLFVENLDTFLGLCENPPQNIVLVYSAGFLGSSNRIRRNNHFAFSFLNSNDEQDRFENWWKNEAENHIQCYFWGDLDYSGMAILKALRQPFPSTQAWKPGYLPLLEKLKAGDGHSQQSSGKSLQKDPTSTGCKWADELLLPTMREYDDFIDQEAVDLQQDIDWKFKLG